MKKTLSLLAALMISASPALAQDNSKGTESSTQPAQAAPAPQQDPATLEQRVTLAKKMHEIRPTQDQVFAAIDQVAQSQPESERADFVAAMRSILNIAAIEKMSVDAMAETYTAEELKAMVDYYSKPEAKSAAEKDVIYSGKVYPEIIRMLDQAMMRIRTGGQ